MKRAGKFLYPVTKKTMHDYAASIFGPISRGECVTSIWVPMAGRRMWNRFIIDNISLFEKELPNYKKYLLAYIEPLELTDESPEGYLKLMGKTLVSICQGNSEAKKIVDNFSGAEVFESDSASYSKILEILKSLLKEITANNLEVIFFLGEFDELEMLGKGTFYHNLKSLWDLLNHKIHFIFLSIVNLTTSEMVDKLGELNAATMQNVIYVPIKRGEDTDYILDFFCNKFDCELNEEERKVIKDLSGGHPYLMKIATRVVSQMDEKDRNETNIYKILESHYEALSVSKRLFDLRTGKEKSTLYVVYLKRPLADSAVLKNLINLGLVLKDGDKYTLFSNWFGMAVSKYADDEEAGFTQEDSDNKLYLDKETGAVCLKGRSVEEKFTNQEYNVVKFLLTEEGVLKTRDNISEILWGDETYEKYSDWAIDQVISKVRRKIKDLDTDTKLVTIRGRGYKIL